MQLAARWSSLDELLAAHPDLRLDLGCGWVKEPGHVGLDDLRGVSRLAVRATTQVTTLVEEMHQTIAGGPDIFGRPLAIPARLVTAPVYESIRGVTRLVGSQALPTSRLAAASRSCRRKSASS